MQGSGGKNIYSDIRSKIINIARDVSLDADLAITGLGFPPKAVIFFWAVAGGTDCFGVGADNKIALGEWVIHGSSVISCNTNLSLMIYDATNLNAGKIKSLDPDGFTLQWNKSGTTPTGTATILAIAFR